MSFSRYYAHRNSYSPNCSFWKLVFDFAVETLTFRLTFSELFLTTEKFAGVLKTSTLESCLLRVQRMVFYFLPKIANIKIQGCIVFFFPLLSLLFLLWYQFRTFSGPKKSAWCISFNFINLVIIIIAIRSFWKSLVMTLSRHAFSLNLNLLIFCASRQRAFC